MRFGGRRDVGARQQAVHHRQRAVARARRRGVPAGPQRRVDAGVKVRLGPQRHAPRVAADDFHVAGVVHLPARERRARDPRVAAALVDKLDGVKAVPARSVAKAHVGIHLDPRVVVAEPARVDAQPVDEFRAVVCPKAAPDAEEDAAALGREEPAAMPAALAEPSDRSGPTTGDSSSRQANDLHPGIVRSKARRRERAADAAFPRRRREEAKP
eukprot:6202092-Prymnesium_polylepis.2